MKAANISDIEFEVDETALDVDRCMCTVKIDIGDHKNACTVIGWTLDDAFRRAVIIADAFIDYEKSNKC